MIVSRRRSGIGVLLLLLLAAFSTSPTASAAPQCGRRDPMVASLARIYGEHLVETGLSHAGVAVEVFATADGATFTILRSWPNGVSCVLDHGENWRPHTAQPDTGDDRACDQHGWAYLPVLMVPLASAPSALPAHSDVLLPSEACAREVDAQLN